VKAKERAQEQAQTQAQATLMRKTSWMRLGAIRKRLGASRNMIGFDDAVDVDPLFAKILTKAKEGVEKWGGKLYFVYLPEYKRYSTKGISHDRYRKKSEVVDVVKGLNIPVIDIHREVFADHPDPLALFPFRLSGHYNAQGYSEVAKAIVESIKD